LTFGQHRTSLVPESGLPSTPADILDWFSMSTSKEE